MTTRFKDFGTGGEVSSEPISFKLHGQDFECHPNLQGRALLELAANSSEEDGAAAAKTINDFFSAALKPESYTRFEVLLKDPNTIVTVETLGEITAWLVEEYSARPTQEPLGS
jgi:hypothetical protein